MMNYEINSEKLRAALNMKGYTMIGASKEMGRSHAFMSGVIYNGYANAATIKMIENVLGIPSDMYVVTKREEPVEEHNDLEDIISRAIVKAVKQLQTEGLWF